MSQMKASFDALLTGVSSAYIPKGYISEALLPKVYSVAASGLLAKYGQEHLRISQSIKGGRGKYRRVEAVTRSTTSYYIDGHGLEGFVSKEDYANVLAPYDAEKDEVIGLTSKLWLEKEVILATALSSTSTLTLNTTLSGSSQFSDYNNSDPVGVFKAARNAVLNGCGVMPNVAWMDVYTWNTLAYHPQILDALGYKYQRPGGLLFEEMAKAMGVEKVLIAMPRYNSAKEGQTDVLSACWGKHVWFGVLPEVAQPYQVSLGYEVRYQGEQPRKVYKEAQFNPPGSTAILIEDNYDQLLSNTSAAYLIKDAVA